MNINSVIWMITAIIVIIINIMKFFIRYVQIDIAITFITICAFAACKIIEINVYTYRIIRSDLNWLLSWAYQERFMIVEVFRFCLIRIRYCICFQSNSLILVEWSFVSYEIFTVQLTEPKLDFPLCFLPLTVIRKLHLADNPSWVEATYVIGWTYSTNRLNCHFGVLFQVIRFIKVFSYSRAKSMTRNFWLEYLLYLLFAFKRCFFPINRTWKFMLLQFHNEWIRTECHRGRRWINNIDNHTTNVKLVRKWTSSTECHFCCTNWKGRFQSFPPYRLRIDIFVPIDIGFRFRYADQHSILIFRFYYSHIFGTCYCRSWMLIMLLQMLMMFRGFNGG